MATLLTKLIIRNDTSTNWTAQNPILVKGELGIEWATVDSVTFPRFKIGDGVTTWTNLPYFNECDVTISGSGNTITGASFNSTTGKLTLTKGDRVEGGTFTANEIVLGNGSNKITSSGKTITTTAPTSSSTDSTVPTSKAVASAISSGITGAYWANVHVSANSDETTTPIFSSMTLKGGTGANTHSIKFTSDATRNMIDFIHQADYTTGDGIRIGAGGLVVVGAGESSSDLITAESLAAGQEVLHLAADDNVNIWTNCQTIANRLKFTFNTSGQLVIPAASGTAPLSVTSTTKVNNLNVDKVDGYDVATSDSNDTINSLWYFTSGTNTIKRITVANFKTALNIAAVMNYKGSKNNYSDLPASGNVTGDVWNIVNADPSHSINAGDNVCWNGSSWDNLGNYVNLSNIAFLDANNSFTGANTFDSITAGNIVVNGGLTVAGTITGNVSGNATSADKVNHTISFKNTSNTTVSFDGSANVDLTGGVYYAATANKVNKAISFKNASNTTVSFDGSAAVDLTGGVYYAVTAGDSAKLNGQAASYYLNASNLNAGTIGNARLPLRIQAYSTSGFSNANSATEQGFHYLASNSSNSPTGWTTDYRILTTAHSSEWLQQIATNFRNNEIWYRRNENNSWKAWIRLLTTDDLANLHFTALSADSATIGNLTVTGAASFTNTINGSISGNATTATKVGNAITFNNGGSGAASGTTFDGSAARTISYNTIGAAPTSHASTATTYGVGTTANYGHVKTQSGDMNGTSSTDGIAAGLGHTHSQYAVASDATIEATANKIAKRNADGDLNAVAFNLCTVSTSTTKAEMRYNTTDDCIEFVFA